MTQLHSQSAGPFLRSLPYEQAAVSLCHSSLLPLSDSSNPGRIDKIYPVSLFLTSKNILHDRDLHLETTELRRETRSDNRDRNHFGK